MPIMSQRIDRHNWIEEYGDLLFPSPVPEPQFTPWATIHEYKKAFRSLAYNREENDCGVRALAVACTVPYEKAHWSLQEAGRIAGQSCCMPQMIDAANRLRFAMVPTDCKSRTLLTVERELKKTHGGFIVTTSDHAVGVWNGEMIDHARGRLWRLDGIYRIEPMQGSE